MRRAALALAILAWVTSVLPAWADEPPPDVIAEARAHYDRGRDLYEHGHYADALVELRRAYELAPSFRIQRSIGLVQGELGDYAGAIGSLERFLEAGADSVTPAERKETEARLASYRQHVAALEIAASPPGAAILIDGAAAGAAPLKDPVLVNAGHHTVTASLDGYVEASREVDTGAGDRLRVDLALEPRPSPPPPAASTAPPAAAPPPAITALPPPHPPPAAPSPPPSRRVPWIGWTATGVLAAGAAVTGIVALSAASELHDKRANTPTPGTELDSIASRAKTLALVSDLCTAAAVVAGGLSLYFTLVPAASPAGRDRVGGSAPPAPDRAAVRVGAAPGRVLVDLVY